MEKTLREARLEAESLVEKIKRAEELIDKRGFKTALTTLRRQAMASRHNLKDLRAFILDFSKKA